MSAGRHRLQTQFGLVGLLALASLGACQPPDAGSPTALGLRSLDLPDFVCRVQPVTAARCSMTACHGVADHAFRVYSPGKLRLVPQATQVGRDAQLTLDEVAANLASMRGLAPASEAVDASALLRKPLAPSQGGGEHKGGVLFASTTDHDYQALRAFLGGEALPDGCDLLKTLQMAP